MWLWESFRVCLTAAAVSSRAAPHHRPPLETAAGCPGNIWNSRCASAGLCAAWAATWFSPGSQRLGGRSASALRSGPSASPPRCSTSSPACAVYTWRKAKNAKFRNLVSLHQWGESPWSFGLICALCGHVVSPEELLLHAVLQIEVWVRCHGLL